MISEGSCDTEDWSNDAEKAQYDEEPESRPQLYHRLLSRGLLSGAASYHCACCTHGTAAKFLDYYAGMRV